MPTAGGQYVFLREAYGRMPAFLFGWIFFLAYLNGVIAYISLAFADYLGKFFPTLSTSNVLFAINSGGTFSPKLSVGHIVAVTVISILSLINFYGVRLGKGVQNAFTVVKIGIILIFIACGLTLGAGPAPDLSINPGGVPFGQLVTGFGLALMTAFVAFDGWQSLTWLGGEIKNPTRNLTRALLIGTGIATLLYLLINLVYLRALTVEQMANSGNTIADSAARALHGEAASGLVSAAVLISIFGGLNGVILAGPRIYYAMAGDGVFFRKAGEIHPRHRTPAFAILIQAVWASVLVLSGTVGQLITFVMFVGTAFWVVTGTSLFVLRRKYPHLQRPYKVWGYPVVPIIFIVASFYIMINTLINRPVESLPVVGLTVLGIPVYYYWQSRNRESQ
jgi:APA family basic amino acid/polyamine antiporter